MYIYYRYLFIVKRALKILSLSCIYWCTHRYIRFYEFWNIFEHFRYSVMNIISMLWILHWKKIMKKLPLSLPLWDSRKINLFYMDYIEYIWNMHRITEKMFWKYMEIVKFFSFIDFSSNFYNRYFPVKN